MQSVNRIKNIFILGLVLVLTGCAYFQESPQSRGVSFPLSDCSNKQLLEAQKVSQRSSQEPVPFTDEWVCVTQTKKERKVDADKNDEKVRLERQAFSSEESDLRSKLERPPFVSQPDRPLLGIALSGGGTKAASFAMGVLAGLADNDLLDRADFISSVSGGGFAAYFYFSHRVFPLVRGAPREVIPSRVLFQDCYKIPSAEFANVNVIRDVTNSGGCENGQLQRKTNKDLEMKYQAFVRCQQDVFNPGYCSLAPTSEDSGIGFFPLLGTLTLFPFTNISNSLFDWGYSTALSARTYHDGIGITYGSTISSSRYFSDVTYAKGKNVKCGPDPADEVFDCRPNIFDPDPQALSFDELRLAYFKTSAQGGRLPFWIINATAPQHRSGLGWWSRGSDDKTNGDMFEMTPISHGSGRYGYVSAPMSLHNKMTVLDAVSASAAFFDSNELEFRDKPIVRGTFGVLQHVFNLDWGLDIANYNVSDDRRYLHKLLPIPFYWLDGAAARYLGSAAGSAEREDRVRSSMIRLIDGGNAENLGVYSLIKRKVANIVISDAAEDIDGQFNDLCGLAARLAFLRETGGEFPTHVYIPGLGDFASHCLKLAKGDEQGFSLHHWSFDVPVLLGCLRLNESHDPAPCSSLEPQDIRLFIVKPAIDIENLKSKQLKKGILVACRLPTDSPESGEGMLNCESANFLQVNKGEVRKNGCPIFPQHTTTGMTKNSSSNLYAAYRELARQYVDDIGMMLRDITDDNGPRVEAIEKFNRIIEKQASHQASVLKSCL